MKKVKMSLRREVISIIPLVKERAVPLVLPGFRNRALLAFPTTVLKVNMVCPVGLMATVKVMKVKIMKVRNMLKKISQFVWR